MANIKYIIKDPSFKYFIIGLVLFIGLTAGGIVLVKKLVSDRDKQTEVAVVEEKTPTESSELIITQDNQTDQTTETTQTAAETVETTPTELSRTGGNGLATALMLSAFVYGLVFVLQKR